VLGQLPLERLGLFKAKELPVHGTFDFQSDVLPLGNPAFGWFGDTFAFIGAQTDNAKGGKDDIGYRFIDTDAQVRGAGKLPMKLPEAASGFTHRTINEVAAAIRGGVLAGADGKFHVAWTDVQEDASFNTVTLIGYEELACTGTPAR
ncbi:MAG: hypothetical protein FJ096_11815, partial [Deltaproteobacteria bacterium]|nr:hypothetical protein [Deltaproteobacteria bacterium]